LSTNQVDTLVDGLSRANPVALARLISWAENRDSRIGEVLRRVYPETGKAYRLGITGPPGGGKSTLIARLAVELRARGEKVAVVAVDPSSPFSGGALLGDRYRMTELSEDPEIFMRSMATRGSLGGLAAATEEALDLLDAAGFSYLLVETVGVGQVELDIAKATDTVAVVLVPESGDGIQAMKAGLMEIGDVFVVNKADRDGADRLAGELESMLSLRPVRDGWRPEVLLTTAHRAEGVEDFLEAMIRHRKHLEESGALQERRRSTLKQRLLGEAREALLNRLETEEEGLEGVVDRLARRELTPHDAARQMVDRLSGDGSSHHKP
jgi:LAO/AO transport system kinase